MFNALPIVTDVAVVPPMVRFVPDESKVDPIIEYIPIDKLLNAVPTHPPPPTPDTVVHVGTVPVPLLVNTWPDVPESLFNFRYPKIFVELLAVILFTEILLDDKLSMDTLNIETLLAVMLSIDALSADKLSIDVLNMDTLLAVILSIDALLDDKLIVLIVDTFYIDMFTDTFDLPIFTEVAVPVPIDNNVPDESNDECIIEVSTHAPIVVFKSSKVVVS